MKVRIRSRLTSDFTKRIPSAKADNEAALAAEPVARKDNRIAAVLTMARLPVQ